MLCYHTIILYHMLHYVIVSYNHIILQMQEPFERAGSRGQGLRPSLHRSWLLLPVLLILMLLPPGVSSI